MYFVYILKCCDNSFYTGCTKDIEDRVRRHNLGHVHFTRSRIPVTLQTFIAFHDKYKAYEFEQYLKSGSGIAFRNKRLI